KRHFCAERIGAAPAIDQAHPLHAIDDRAGNQRIQQRTIHRQLRKTAEVALLENRRLELSEFHGPVGMKLILHPGIEQRHRPTLAVGVPDEGVGEILAENVAIETKSQPAKFKSVLDVITAIGLGLLSECGDAAELGVDRRLEQKRSIIVLNEKAIVIARIERAAARQKMTAAAG